MFAGLADRPGILHHLQHVLDLALVGLPEFGHDHAGDDGVRIDEMLRSVDRVQAGRHVHDIDHLDRRPVGAPELRNVVTQRFPLVDQPFLDEAFHQQSDKHFRRGSGHVGIRFPHARI